MSYDGACESSRWRVRELKLVQRLLVETIKDVYENGKSCVQMGREENELSIVKLGQRQGCVMSLWVFNI